MPLPPRLAAVLVATPLLVGGSALHGAVPAPWGRHGHEMAARAAATELPDAMPGFFRAAADPLVYLDPEPDRWRRSDAPAEQRAESPDHYVHLENVPPGALDAPDRWSFLERLEAAGVAHPARDVGFLPWRILELYQRLTTEFRLWRHASPPERDWIEARVVNDAGILGHYVTDASQPLHTTIHHGGWARGVPNPEGFTTDPALHTRFETGFVDAHVRLEDVVAAERKEPRTLADPWAAILAHVEEAHRAVPELYRLERDVGFRRDGPADPEAKAFTVERLAAGASMLRDLWWSAWVASGKGG